jgi:hypothetical protein
LTLLFDKSTHLIQNIQSDFKKWDTTGCSSIQWDK